MKRKINKKLILFSSLITLGLSSSIIIASCTPNKSKTPEKPKQGTENGRGSGSMSGNNTGGTTSGSTGGNNGNGGSSKNNEQMNGLGTQPQNPKNNGGSSGSNTTPTTPSANKNANFSISLPSGEESIALDPASDVGYFKVNINKLNPQQNLEDKVLIVEIKDQNQQVKKAFAELKIWKENEPITLLFVGLKQNDKYTFNDVYVVNKNDRNFGEVSKDKQIKVVIPSNLATKQIDVKVQSNKKVLTEEEKKKTPIKFILTEKDGKLNLAAVPGQTDVGTPIKDKYVRLSLFQLYQDQWTTSTKLNTQIHKIENNNIDISKIDISEFKEKKDKIAIFVDGIYDDNKAVTPSSQYRFDYEDPSALFTKNDSLVLIKDFGANNQQ
ncbi:hypothetical protein JM47_01925 [Ureaplasma diversum]|uniref:Lipoprotein n=1 Tax=Ureaplasma diversum TaxID=42094 RepID=A0A0C5S1W0_9BACT|nr:hypothetical protein [Ureaplasma diversum]AJQ45350.1 hypothetical protein JM47_01925 [Ureaplasma diversum]